MIKVYLVISACFFAFTGYTQVSFTANEKVNPYNTEFLYGVNVGHYTTWDDKAKADIAAGNPALNIKGAGVKTYHAPLPETFLETWGYGIRVNEFNHYASLGMKDHTIFLEGPTAAHKDNNKYGGCLEESKLFKNLYDPIWDGGANGTPYNDNNYYAAYVYKVVNTYKAYTKFWEVINEPDMGPKAFEPKGSPGNWWENAPAPCDLTNIKAPVFHYIRMLRITYDIVKTLDPSAYVGPGGIGSGSFMDAVLRYTDNPVDGSVTAAYPAKGGAYFDAMSFHFYPMYSLKFWQNGGFAFKRHSDAAINGYISHKNYLTNIVSARGYDGVTYPKKIAICTENGMPRKSFGELVGSDETQRNYIIKSVVESQKNDVRQYYTFILGDGKYESDATWEFDLMGFYLNLNNNGPIQGPGYKQQYSNAGKAHKTTSDLLLGFRYDAAKTDLLNLPSNIGGAAFLKGAEYRYVLWAKTTTDLSEAATATYSFPAATNVTALKRREWNFMETGVSSAISAQNISLNGSPSFFLEGGTVTPPPPQAPIAQAGTDITITSPVASANLDGSQSTAPGGTITKFYWSLISGPSGSKISSPDLSGTAITDLVQGSYIFRLAITNNSGVTATDDVSVTVNAGLPTQLPVANAGKDEAIPVGQATVLHGEYSTATAGIKSYAWTKFSGPALFEMLTPAANTTWIRNMVAGVYVFRLTITDNNGASSFDDVVITSGSGIAPAPNILPLAKAGSDVSITLPVNSITLNSAGSTDEDGTIKSYKWNFVSGPSTYLIASPDAASSLVSNLSAGTYTFRLTVTDNAGGTGTDDVIVFVNNISPGGNISVNAGKDESIPVGQATVLNGGNSTAVAGIKTYAWTKFAGPAPFEMLTPSANNTWIRNMAAGVYVFRLTVTDNNGGVAFDDVVITVGSGSTPAPNVLPVAKAGNDITITLPINSITLSNAGSTDQDGTITNYQWSFVSGPSTYNINSPNTASTVVSSLVTGNYIFRLKVTDNAGGVATDDILVTVINAPGVGGINANAGKDEAIPTNQATVLRGEASTAIAGIKSYAWTKITGPAALEMLTPFASSTWIRNMTSGIYVFRLTVTDNNGASASDEVTITVGTGAGTPANQAPVARAGNDITISLPLNSITLNNAGSSDADGIITGYKWTWVSGPATYLMAASGSATNLVSNLIAGTYIFRLTVTDNAGATATDDVTVTVKSAAASNSITANAGKDETIPTGQATVLHGENSTAVAGIKSFAWSKISGPVQFEMLTPSSNTTWIRNMTAGVYVYRCTITDNNGATGYDDVTITVFSAASNMISGSRINEVNAGVISGESIVVYPNPVENVANIKWSGIYTGTAIISIVDGLGVIVKRNSVNKYNAQLTSNIDVRALRPGVYMIEIKLQNGKSIIKKMFKK